MIDTTNNQSPNNTTIPDDKKVCVSSSKIEPKEVATTGLPLVGVFLGIQAISFIRNGWRRITSLRSILIRNMVYGVSTIIAAVSIASVVCW